MRLVWYLRGTHGGPGLKGSLLIVARDAGPVFYATRPAARSSSGSGPRVERDLVAAELVGLTVGIPARAGRRRRRSVRRYAAIRVARTFSSMLYSSARTNVATTSGSNCVPAQRSSSATAAARLRARWYGRSVIMASKASQTKVMRASIGMSVPARPSG